MNQTFQTFHLKSLSVFVDARQHTPHGDGADDDAHASLVCAPITGGL
jgi:hypothetical protein